jgi:cytochrome c oxidase subunit 1
MIAGIHLWWPKITGRMYSELAGKIAWLFVFVGINMTFFPQFVMGSRGMPRRYYNYPPEFEWLHQLSSYGSYLMGLGFVLMAAYLLHSLFRGKPAPANPWGGGTLEWRCSSPPMAHNFDTPPPVGDPYDFSDLEYDPSEQGYVLRRPPAGGMVSPADPQT